MSETTPSRSATRWCCSAVRGRRRSGPRRSPGGRGPSGTRSSARSASGSRASTVAEGMPKQRRGLRRAAIGVGLTVAGVGAALVAERLATRRMRARPDPETGELFGLQPPEDLGTVRSFDGTELTVRAAGPEGAPAVVFLHGVTLDLTTWYYQWRVFSERYRCVLFDQ